MRLKTFHEDTREASKAAEALVPPPFLDSENHTVSFLRLM